NGLVFPVHIATLAANGWGSIRRFRGASKAPVTLAEHRESGGQMMLPIHVLFMDNTSYTARVIVRASSKTQEPSEQSRKPI
ncbi:MAG TPA: hypothetical protein VJ728_04025, partial [Candidatus Binataceae bacterium]|nr:hypothetical protein [Candidatus Binataceae bacterium]